MKIRNGFISNSSSSSFVIIGVSASRDQLGQIGVDLGLASSKKEACSQYLEQISMTGLDVIYESNYPNILIGDIIFRSSGENGDLDADSIDIEDIFQSKKSILECAPKLIDCGEVMVYSGTMCC